MGDCLKELSEIAYWLELLKEENLGDQKVLPALLQETGELTAIFTTIIKNTKQSSG